MRRKRSNGFSALEALLAIAILAFAMIPILTIQANATRSLTDSQIAIENLDHAQSALAILDSLNVMETPEGNRSVTGPVQLRWQSQQITPIRATRLADGSIGAFEVALFRVTAEIAVGARSATVTVHQLGWRTRRR